MQSANLNFLEPSGPLQACNGTALPLYILKIKKYSSSKVYLHRLHCLVNFNVLLFIFRKQLYQYSASVSPCVLNFVTVPTARILCVTSSMKGDESGFLIIKFNIKSLEDWRLLTNLERDSPSLAYIFLNLICVVEIAS
jgi:hypothetical protein